METPSAHTSAGRHSTAAWAYGDYVWLLFTLLALLFGAAAVLLRPPWLSRRVVRPGARMLLILAGMPPTVQGLEHLPGTPHVLLGRHASGRLTRLKVVRAMPVCLAQRVPSAWRDLTGHLRGRKGCAPTNPARPMSDKVDGSATSRTSQ